MAIALCSIPLAASAAGMGKITVLSALGQPLRAEFDVTASREELASLSARVAPVEVFRQANVEYAPVLSSVRFTLDKRPDGKPYFKIQTDRAVNDPFIDFLVELSWSSGRLVREYAFLLDPPELKSDNVTAAVTAPGAQPVVDSASAAIPKMETPAEPAQVKKVPDSAVVKKPKVASDVALPLEEGSANTRKVKRGDTLGKIAAESVTSGVTLDQMLVALFNSNRDAFIGGNMNRLRAGRILNIPDVEKVAAVSAGEARKIVVVQYAAFNAYRNSLAASAASQAPLEQKTQQSSSGKIMPKVEEKIPAVGGQDKLLVSRSEAQAKPAKGKLSEEDIVARDKALKEANSRIGELEKNLVDLKKLAELKSQAATEAQQASQAAKAVPAPAEKGTTIATPAPAPTVSAVAPAPEQPAASAATAVPVAEKEQPQPKTPPIPLPPPPESSFVEDNPLLLYGGGAALAAVLGFLGFRTWKRKRDVDAAPGVTVGDLAASSVFGVAADENLVPSTAAQPDFVHSTHGAVDTEREKVDPIQEAEVYMAYGRDGQAEELLVDAMKKDPDSLAIYLKLLEIYAGRKSLPQFNELASKLHERTGGNGAEWDKAAALGRSLDPANPLYGGVTAPEPESASLPMETTMVMQSPPAQAPVEAATAIAEEVPSALDFDLDLGAAEPVAQDHAPTVVPEAAASDLDFDLDLGNDDKPAVESAQGGDLDINFDTPAKDDSALDFDFDLGDSLPASHERSAPPLDLSSINLDLNEPAASAASGNTDDSTEVATKLELAHAYEEMGDHEGARELLQEVLVEGSPAQQETARSKLAQLG